MRYAAGKLNQRVTLQSPEEEVDSDTGLIQNVWETRGTQWADIQYLSVRDLVQSAAHQSKVTARITLRPVAAYTITAAWRVVHGAKIFFIEGVIPDNIDGVSWVTLAVYEGVNNG